MSQKLSEREKRERKIEKLLNSKKYQATVPGNHEFEKLIEDYYWHCDDCMELYLDEIVDFDQLQDGLEYGNERFKEKINELITFVDDTIEVDRIFFPQLKKYASKRKKRLGAKK